jgi:4-hydroxybenzoate polyprenyltransferase
MPFALIGFFLATRRINFQWNLNGAIGWGKKNVFMTPNEFYLKFVLVILCMIFARSAAMHLTATSTGTLTLRNPRTAIREIPAGIISKGKCPAFCDHQLPAIYCNYFFYQPHLFLSFSPLRYLLYCFIATPSDLQHSVTWCWVLD